MSFPGGGQHFKVRGRLGEREVEVSYDEASLTGDDEAVGRIRQVLDDRDTLRLTPQDDDRRATIADPLAVMAAIQEVLAIDAIDGDYPIPEADDSAS